VDGTVNLLAIETATDLVGAALVTDDHAAERSHQGGRRHAESLAPAIEEVCALTGLTVRELDVVAVDVGPGLFTGLRVGVATAKALAQGLGIGVLGVGSLDVLAAGALEMAGGDGPVTVVSVVDARRGEVFVARYDVPAGGDGGSTGGRPDPDAVRAAPPALLTPAALADSLVATDPGHERRVVVVGDGAVRHLDLLMAAGAADCSLAETVSSPSPLVLGRLATRRLAGGWEASDPLELAPDYRREADARINWEQRTPPDPPTP
jgi:tRNA threonylcarbamoyladenosine biosynthesis protein TsaB